ncbi:putative DCC family thiol-disulfide oxidoreductase YuxK [Oxalobacteraceae bacterium GrIS 1.11]
MNSEDPSVSTAQSNGDPEQIILFDGVCNLCNGIVRFILAHESDTTIRFAAMQTPTGIALMTGRGLDPDDLSTFIFLDGAKTLRRSDAALRIAAHLAWPWRAAAFLVVLPKAWRDALYDLIGRNRYRWFGREDRCAVLEPEQARRFLF